MDHQTIEQRLGALLDSFNKLAQAMTMLLTRVKALEENHPPQRKRSATTYSMYLEVRALAGEGMDYKDIAKRLGIPASTCSGYLDDAKWTPEYIEEKRRRNP